MEQCARAATEVEHAARFAVSHREKCWALYGQARATMLAMCELDNVIGMLDDHGRVQAKRQGVQVLSRLHVGAALCRVYGRFTSAEKLARAMFGWKTNQKFEDVTRDLEMLETQLWNLAGASGRVGAALGSSAGDRRRRLLRGGVGRTLDSIFGVGVLAMCSAGSDGSELWWSSGGGHPRLDAYDMFLQGPRDIEGLPVSTQSDAIECVCRRGSKGASSPIVAMANAPNHGLLWAGSKHGGVTIWDCDLGSLMCPDALTEVRNVAVTCIAPVDNNCAWIGYADGTLVEMQALTLSFKRQDGTIDTDADSSAVVGEFKVSRRIFSPRVDERPALADGTSRRGVKSGVKCILFSNDVVFVACENDLSVEIWELKSGTCSRVEELSDLGPVVSLLQHPTLTDLIMSVHVTGAIQIWGGGSCAVAPGTRITTITTGFKSVDAWSTPMSKHFGKRIVGAVAIDRLIVVGHASGELTLWPVPGMRELQDSPSKPNASAQAKALDAAKSLRSGKLIAHSSGLVQLTKVDGGGSVGIATVGRFGSIMFWPLVQLESVLDKVRQPGLRNPRRMIDSAAPFTSPGEEKFVPTRDATDAAQALANTSTISYNHIKLKRKVGEGSFGRVYHAVWNHTDVAVKFIGAQQDEMTQTSSDLDKALDELEKEVGIMTQLRHPNIVLLLGAIRSPPAIVEEYCVRGSLHTVMQRHKKPGAPELTWRVRLQMALGAAAGMCYLHSCSPSILHRDLKSANLMVDRYFRVKVGDFNLSRVLVANTAASGTSNDAAGSASLHSPRWMAPEVLQSSLYSMASDVYSYAIILWEIQTLETPFAEFSQWQIIHAVTMDEERPDVDRSDGVFFYDARRYRALMTRAWKQDPAERPSFEVIIGTLQQFVEEELARDQAARAEASHAKAASSPVKALARKSLSFTSRRGSAAEGKASDDRRFSANARGRKPSNVDLSPITFDVSRGKKVSSDGDDVVIETPAASPEKVTPALSFDGAKENRPQSAAATTESVDILRGMRARSSLNGSSALRSSA